MTAVTLPAIFVWPDTGRMSFVKADLLYVFKRGVQHGLISRTNEEFDVTQIVETQFEAVFNALKAYKEVTQKPQETDIAFAQRLWEKSGKPSDGVSLPGKGHFCFHPDGKYDNVATFNHNMGKDAAAKAGK